METSWLTPAVVPSSSPGPCLLHYADGSHSSGEDYNHIIWTGRHQIIAPKIVSNTPELADDQEFRLLEGTYCATASCGCSLPKLSDAIHQLERGLPAVAAAAAIAPGEDQDALQVPELEEDPHAVDAARLALHSLTGAKCSCPLCLAGKQRRDHAQRLSHPHSEVVASTTAGCHGQDDMPTYFDSIDYGSSQSYLGAARYDLLQARSLDAENIGLEN